MVIVIELFLGQKLQKWTLFFKPLEYFLIEIMICSSTCSKLFIGQLSLLCHCRCDTKGIQENSARVVYEWTLALESRVFFHYLSARKGHGFIWLDTVRWTWWLYYCVLAGTAAIILTTLLRSHHNWRHLNMLNLLWMTVTSIIVNNFCSLGRRLGLVPLGVLVGCRGLASRASGAHGHRDGRWGGTGDRKFIESVLSTMCFHDVLIFFETEFMVRLLPEEDPMRTVSSIVTSTRLQNWTTST